MTTRWLPDRAGRAAGVGLIALSSGLTFSAATIIPPAPVSAAVDYIEVTATCSLDEAIAIANVAGGTTADCADHNPGTRTIRITANSGTTTPPGTTLSVPGLAYDLHTARSGPVVGGAPTALPAITGNVTIEGDPALPQVGIYGLDLGIRRPVCTFVIISQDPLVADTVCTDNLSDRGARLFYVAPSGSLTIRDLNVGGGWIEGSYFRLYDPLGNPVETLVGGAIYAEGALTLDGVSLLWNRIVGGIGQSASGGAVYAATSLTVARSVFDGNAVTGGKDEPAWDANGESTRGPYAGGGSALGGAIGLGPQAQAHISDTIFQNTRAIGGDGLVGAWGSDGGDGADGADGYCTDNPEESTSKTDAGWLGANGDPGGSGGNGGNGGNAVAVIAGGRVVTIDHSSIVDSYASAGAAGAGGIGGVGGDGGDGGDGILCPARGYGALAHHRGGFGGDAGNAGVNGSHGAPGNRGWAVAVIRPFDNGVNARSFVWLTNTTIASATAIVPDDNFGSYTRDEWVTARDRSDTTMAVAGTPGIGQDAERLDNGDGEEGRSGGVSQPSADQRGKLSGSASMFGQSANSSIGLSHSTVADVGLGHPADTTEADRLYRGVPAYSVVTNGWIRTRGSVWWNPGAAAAGCPLMTNASADLDRYNVFLDGSGCRGFNTGDVTTTQRPVSRFVVPLGAPVRPAYDDIGTPYRMPVLTIGPFSAPRDIVPAGVCATLTAEPVTDDARRSPRDQNCDAGAYEWYRPTGTEVWSYGPSRMYRGAADPSPVSVWVEPAPAAGTNLVLRVDGLDGFLFPPGFVLADTAPDNGWSQATYTFTGSEPTATEFELSLSAPLTGTADVFVNARLEGLQQGPVVADQLTIDVLHDGEVAVAVTAPPTWSPCRGYLPITYTARSIGHSPAPASRIRVSPNIVPATAGNGFQTPPGQAPSGTPLVYPSAGTTVAVDSSGQVWWNLPALAPGDPQPTLTTYIAIGKLDPLQVSYGPGMSLAASGSPTYPAPAPNVDRAGIPPTVTRIGVANDLDLLQGLLSNSDPAVSPPFDPAVIPTVIAGQPSQLFASIDAPPASCPTPSSNPYRWSPILLTVRDPDAPATSLLPQTETFTRVDSAPGDAWYPVPFTAPDTPGVHYLEFEFAGPGSAPVKRLTPYRVRPVGLSVVSPEDAPEAVLGRTFGLELELPVAEDTTVQWSTVDSTAQSPRDFTGGTGLVTIPAGSTSGSFVVPTSDDTATEPGEDFFVEIRPPDTQPLPVSVEIAQPYGRAVLVNDDYGLIADRTSVLEGDSGIGAITFGIFSLLAPPTDCSVVVSTVLDGTAGPDDVVAVEQEVTIAGGQAAPLTELITLDMIRGDRIDEGNETFTLVMTPGTTGTPCNVHFGRAPATIEDNDTATISVSDVTVAEGTGAGAGGTVPVELSTPSAVDVTVDVAVVAATAGAADFSAGATVTIPAGSTSATAVLMTPDAIDETDETFEVVLSNPVGAAITDGTSTVTITDDDTATISVGDVSVAEGTGVGATTAAFTIALATPADHDVSVRADTATGTAGASDFTATGIDVVIPAGATSATVAVPITRDADAEADETFALDLRGAIGAPLGDASATATIIDDDQPTVSAGDSTGAEAATGGGGGTTVSGGGADQTGGAAGTVTVVDDGPDLGYLPVTGGAVARLVMIGAVALAVGLALRRAVRPRRQLGGS